MFVVNGDGEDSRGGWVSFEVGDESLENYGKLGRQTLTWIQEEEEFETSVIVGVELELSQLHGERVELVHGRRVAQEGKREQIEALLVRKLHVVAQVVVHSLVNVV